MTLRETKMGLAVIKAAYHEFCRDMDGDERDAVAKLWHDCLGKYSYETYGKAIKYHICNCKFAPKISEIIAEIHRIDPNSKHCPEEMALQTRRLQRYLEEMRQEKLEEPEPVPLLTGHTQN